MKTLSLRQGGYTRSSFALLVALSAALLLSLANPYQQASGAPVVAEASTPEGSEQLPPEAIVQMVVANLNDPVAIAFDPSGRLFYTEKGGAVRLFANGKLQEQPVISFQASTCIERGLESIIVDPNFDSNHYIYVYYTQGPDSADGQCSATENKLVRFVERDGVGSDPTVIFTSPEQSNRHNGGGMAFGPDGKLYLSVGDDSDWTKAQDVTVPNGKIHRLNPDGSVPTDNPVFTQTGALPSLYAIGFRNTFAMAFDPIVKGRMFGAENGPDCDDEMNRIEAGKNYGWRVNYPCDDDKPDPAYNSIAPLWHLGSGSCCEAPTGIVVYTSDQIPEWKNDVMMASYNNGSFFHFHLNADRADITAANIVDGVKANVGMAVGPDGGLYYVEAGGAAKGNIKRIVARGASNLLPVAAATPLPVVTPVPGTGSQTFPETGKTVSGTFLDYWNNNGGLAQQGFPISDVMGEVSDLDGKPYTVQYFERAVFEYHPENQPPYDVLLSQLGTFQYKKKYPSGAPNQTPNKDNGQFFQQTGHWVGGSFWQYWQQHGGLAQQGYPISDEFQEKSDLNGQTYTVQYFERAVFEKHPENQPPYDILLSQLGTLRYKDMYGGR